MTAWRRSQASSTGDSLISPIDSCPAGRGQLKMLPPIALIWAAHIGFDRLVGYGLKYSEAFGATHLGWKGKKDFDFYGREES